VAAFEAEVPDVGAGGFGDPQPVQREQRDQRMLARRAEPGGDQQGAELVAVQRDRMRLVVDPRPPDMGSGRVIQEFFFDRVLIQPGQPLVFGRAAGKFFFVRRANPLTTGTVPNENAPFLNVTVPVS
jgi:hypothetical protein